MSKRQKQNCQVKIFQMLSTTVYYDLMNNLFWPLKDVYKNIYLDDKLSESPILRPQEKVFLLSVEANQNDTSTQTFLKQFFLFQLFSKTFLSWLTYTEFKHPQISSLVYLQLVSVQLCSLKNEIQFVCDLLLKKTRDN
jgi:hypothetical protein